MGKKRNKKEIVEGIMVQRYAAEGKSVGQLPDGKTIFITGAVPGDEVQVLVLKNKATYAEGNALEVTAPSPDRVVPFCPHFGICGGCKWQMLPYNKQLEYKQIQINDQLTRLAKVDLPTIEPILACSEDRLYRNKLEFTFSELRYLSREELTAAEGQDIPTEPVLGFHAPGMWDKVVDIDTCYLMQEPTNAIKNWLRSYAIDRNYSFYNARTQEGWLRNIVLRISSQGSVLVNLIVKEYKQDLDLLLADMLTAHPAITSLHYTINDKVNDAIYDLPVHTFYGVGYIEEHLEHFKFKISPKSFFQTNSKQAERLYQVVRAFARLTGIETVYDMYCGTGSIGIFLSAKAGKVIGIDAVGDAILDAAVNAEWNGLSNTHFVAGDVIKIVNPAFFEKHGRPDVIITDPPRAGMHQQMIDQLLEIAAPRIVYVSCNPATQARDLQLLDMKYKVIRLQPVDMFPQTHHIENVALLELR